MSIYLLILFVAIGVFIEIKAFQLVRFFGHITWAEQKLGPGGSYLAWRLVGLIFIVGSFMVYRYL